MVEKLKEAAMLRQQREQQRRELAEGEDVEMTESEPPALDDDAADDNDSYDAEAWDNAIYGLENDDGCGGDPVLQAHIKQQKMKKAVTIRFSPSGYQQGSLPQICGDPTEWIPLNMRPVYSGADSDFEFCTLLVKGYRYRFWFMVGGAQTLDNAQPISINLDGTPTNYIEVPADDERQEIREVNQQKMENYQADLLAPELRVNFDEIQVEYRSQQDLVTMIRTHEAIVLSMREYQAQIEIAQFNRDEYEVESLKDKLKKADEEFKEMRRTIQMGILGRLASLRSNPDCIFEVKAYNANLNEITLRAIYDDYQILLKTDTQMASCLPTVTAARLQSDYFLLDRKQEVYWKKQIQTDNYIFVIKYTIVQNRGNKECLFHQILPTRLGFSSIETMLRHYYITYHPTTRQVTNIRNRKMGDVCFRAIRMDTNAGLQYNSEVQLWTHHNRKVFNIVHLHLNDTSDEVPIDVQYLESRDYALKEISFQKDVSGKPLRYKILVHDWQIRDVLYNNGGSVEPISFVENKIDTESYHLTEKRYFGKIANVPYALLTYPDQSFVEEIMPLKESVLARVNSCQQRCFERLQGQVDFELYSRDGVESLLQPPSRCSVAICKLEKPEQWQVQTYELLCATMKDQEKFGIQTQLAQFQSLLLETQSDLESWLTQIKQAEAQLENLVIEDNEMKLQAKDLLTKLEAQKIKIGRQIKFGGKQQ